MCVRVCWFIQTSHLDSHIQLEHVGPNGARLAGSRRRQLLAASAKPDGAKISNAGPTCSASYLKTMTLAETQLAKAVTNATPTPDNLF